MPKTKIYNRYGFDEFSEKMIQKNPNAHFVAALLDIDNFKFINDISKHLPGAFIIYRADRKNDELFYANNEFLHMSGYKDMDELFRLTKKSFRNLIREDEQQQIESSIWEQIDSGNENNYIHFHLRKADGTYLSVLDHGRIVDSQQHGRVFYVLFMDWEDMYIRYNKILKEKMKDKNAYIK